MILSVAQAPAAARRQTGAVNRPLPCESQPARKRVIATAFALKKANPPTDIKIQSQVLDSLTNNSDNIGLPFPCSSVGRASDC